MKCSNCGAETRATQRDYEYKESGLSNVVLSGITIHDCSECGEEFPEIPNINRLHERIADRLLEKQSLLTGAELKFLRQCMGMKANELASSLGVDAVTVSRWETNATPVGPQSDRLVRAVYLLYKLKSLRGIVPIHVEGFEVFHRIVKRLGKATNPEPVFIIPPLYRDEDRFFD